MESTVNNQQSAVNSNSQQSIKSKYQSNNYYTMATGFRNLTVYKKAFALAMPARTERYVRAGSPQSAVGKDLFAQILVKDIVNVCMKPIS